MALVVEWETDRRRGRPAKVRSVFELKGEAAGDLRCAAGGGHSGRRGAVRC
jgi:hypothetical protein